MAESLSSSPSSSSLLPTDLGALVGLLALGPLGVFRDPGHLGELDPRVPLLPRRPTILPIERHDLDALPLRRVADRDVRFTVRACPHEGRWRAGGAFAVGAEMGFKERHSGVGTATAGFGFVDRRSVHVQASSCWGVGRRGKL